MYQEISDQGTSNNFNQHKCKGIIIMRSSKDRTIEKKRRNKAMGVKRTEQSRARRISNKHKRQEIHDIDPNLKVYIMDEKIYDIHGSEIEVVDGKIKPVLINGIYKVNEENTYNPKKEKLLYDSIIDEDDLMEEMQKEIVIENIETKNKSALERLTDRFRKK